MNTYNTIRPALRALGSNDLRVSEIGCGCSSLAGVLDRNGEAAGLNMLKVAIDRGVNFFDTADAYSLGRSEELLGLALRGRRDKVVIATKGGSRFTPAWQGVVDSRSLLVPLRKVMKPYKRYFNKLRNTQKLYDYSADHMRRSLEMSLKRLGTDYIDLYQLYNPTRADLETGEFIETLEAFKLEGKIRYYGIALHTAEDALECLRYPGVSSIQFAVSLADQEGLSGVIGQIAAQGVGVIASEPLAQGLLTAAKGHTMASESARNSAAEICARKERASAFGFLATSERSLAQAALRFALDVPGVSSVIPGMVRAAEVEENLGALGIAPFSAEEWQRIDRLTGRARAA